MARPVRAANLRTSPHAADCAVSSEDEARTENEAASTGPQRTLEASSYITLGPGVASMDSAFEALPIASVIAYRDGAPLTVNARARALLHLSAADQLRSLSELASHARLTTSDGNDLHPVLERALDGETLTGVSAVAEGTRRWTIDASPMQDGAVLTLRDITERFLDEEMGDELLGRASHDLRTPLTALKASAQLIGRGFERLDEHARQRTLGLLLAQIDKLATRIDEVMDASRIRRGRIDLHPEQLDLGALLRDVAAELGATPGMPRCELIAPETLTAHGDRARVHQIIKRLAVDQASRGTDTITIEATAGDSSVTVIISANGTPPTDARNRTARRLAAKVFERLGGSAHEDRASRLVLTLPLPR